MCTFFLVVAFCDARFLSGLTHRFSYIVIRGRPLRQEEGSRTNRASGAREARREEGGHMERASGWILWRTSHVSSGDQKGGGGGDSARCTPAACRSPTSSSPGARDCWRKRFATSRLEVRLSVDTCAPLEDCRRSGGAGVAPHRDTQMLVTCALYRRHWGFGRMVRDWVLWFEGLLGTGTMVLWAGLGLDKTGNHGPWRLVGTGTMVYHDVRRAW